VIAGEKAFDPELHRPVPLSERERAELGAPVGFVGHWEAPRAADLARLRAAGIELRIHGQRWSERTRGTPLAACVAGGPRFGEDYVRLLNAFDIALCFLRRQAEDRVTSRSVEIPACGTFMLAERTPEHEALFREGEEAEFFSDARELEEKVRHYLAHPDQREAIAAAGRARCLASGYDHDARMRALLETIFSEG
jgi:hypothetical protein